MQVTISVYRYNPETDAKPFMKDYQLDVAEGSDMMVLDALLLLKEQDPSLSFRRSCREGVCGSDGMNMNGKNGLACITPLSALLKQGNKVVVRPLPGLPVVRDLVIDLTQFYTQWEKIKPFLIADEKLPPRASIYKARPSAKSWTDSTSAYCALAVRPLAHRFGGIRISLLALLACWPPIVGCLTAATPVPKSAYRAWKMRLAYSAATPS